MKNIKIFILYIYTLPTFVALLLIYNYGHLIGDFRTYYYNMDIVDLVYTCLIYLTPLLILYLFIKSFEGKYLLKPKTEIYFNKYILYLFMFILLITLCFGAVQIGQPNVGFAAPLRAIIVKINPYVLLLIISFSNLTIRKFAFCILVCLFYGYMQHSLQGYLITFFSVMVFILNRKNLSTDKFILLLMLPILLSHPLMEILTYIYQLRSEARGNNFNSDEVIFLSIGRISAISSYLYIKDFIHNFSGVSQYFSIGLVQDKLLGFSFFNITSPSDLFNKDILGITDYSIFLGINGFIYYLFQSSIVTGLINILFILFILLVIYNLIPYYIQNTRLPLFFLVLYLPMLSSDIWELSMLLQTLIVINIGFWLFKNIYMIFKDIINE
ncbi:oligosaccharide repeat unit polymerase [Photobacterium damselae subsp. damselae]|uniref:Oligosaccharide repeat unit polymerase n=1 Tax=Photobacterium damselae subsp. damselae TaxID=85581 RepID=A0A850QUA5_PHODD|nr:oligosaccharide repeat unit polymerase [Photobacterium damselae subsp. damselae]